MSVGTVQSLLTGTTPQARFTQGSLTCALLAIGALGLVALASPATFRFLNHKVDLGMAVGGFAGAGLFHIFRVSLGAKETPTPPSSPSIPKSTAELKVPNEVLRVIFSFLSPSALVSAGLVCKNWNEVAETASLWNTRLPPIQGSPLACYSGHVFRNAVDPGKEHLDQPVYDIQVAQDNQHVLLAHYCPILKNHTLQLGEELIPVPSNPTLEITWHLEKHLIYRDHQLNWIIRAVDSKECKKFTFPQNSPIICATEHRNRIFFGDYSGQVLEYSLDGNMISKFTPSGETPRSGNAIRQLLVDDRQTVCLRNYGTTYLTITDRSTGKTFSENSFEASNSADRMLMNEESLFFQSGCSNNEPLYRIDRSNGELVKTEIYGQVLDLQGHMLVLFQPTRSAIELFNYHSSTTLRTFDVPKGHFFRTIQAKACGERLYISDHDTLYTYHFTSQADHLGLPS